MGIPKEASEVLMLRLLRNKEAKSVFVPMNSNGNPRGYAIITFESQEELERARSKPINYGNHTLFWDRYEARKVSVKEGKGKNVELREEEKEEAAGQEMDYEYQNKDIKKNGKKGKKKK